MRLKMTDIHTHILPEVDDGSISLEQSLSMLGELYAQGVTEVILTPHYRNEYVLSPEQLKTAFCEFKGRVFEAGIPVGLYLGQEIYIGRDYKKILSEKKVLTINGTNYILIEFDFTRETDIAEIVYELKSMGYIPIVAHFERYTYVDVSVAKEIKELGGLIQINADSIVGKYKRRYSRLVKELLSEKLVDFIASDIHSRRKVLTEKARKVIEKKYGEEYAEKIFSINAERLIKN